MMFQKPKSYQMAAALLLIATVLVSTGCPPGSPVPMGVPPPPHPFFERPAITTDGAGGVIVFYAYQVGLDRWLWHKHWCRWRGFYVQRLDKEGSFLWGEGVLVGKGYTRGREALQIVSDEAGGAIVIWKATHNRITPEERHAIHVARVGHQGEILWEQEFLDETVGAPSLGWGDRFLVTSDGLGGVIIIGHYQPNRLTIQRIDSRGQFLWGEAGIQLLTQEPLAQAPFRERSFNAVGTRKGNIIVVWEQEDGAILAQAIPEGEALWQEQVQVGIGRWPEVTPDRLGGAIIAWKRSHHQQDDHARRWDVLAQRIDAQGNLLWQEEGVPVFAFTTQSFLHPELDRVGILNLIHTRPDETIVGLAILHERYIGLYAQKIDSEGNVLWQEGGRRISTGSIDHSSIVGDNFGGAILMWARQVFRDGRLLQAQRLDSAGKPLWPERGVQVTTAPGGRFSVIPDGEGGVFVAWVAHEYGPLQAYIQRIAAAGTSMWGDEGLLLDP